MAEELPSDESPEEHLEKIKDELQIWLDSGGDIEDVLEPAAEAFSRLDSDIVDAAEGARLESAETEAELEYHGWPVSVNPHKNESNEMLKKRIDTQYNQLSTRGSPQDILEYTAALLEVDKNRVTLNNIEDEANFILSMKREVVENAVGSPDLAESLIQQVSAATYGVKFYLSGTFQHITKEEYENNNYEADHGYGTLDSDGNIVGGGEYSTLY